MVKTIQTYAFKIIIVCLLVAMILTVFLVQTLQKAIAQVVGLTVYFLELATLHHVHQPQIVVIALLVVVGLVAVIIVIVVIQKLVEHAMLPHA